MVCKPLFLLSASKPILRVLHKKTKERNFNEIPGTPVPISNRKVRFNFVEIGGTCYGKTVEYTSLTSDEDKQRVVSSAYVIEGRTDSSFMERNSWFRKWLSKILGGSGLRTSNGRQPESIGEQDMFWHGPVRSWDDESKNENEDLDYAIALSLAEVDRKPNEYKGQDKDDEDLAKATQESLNASLFYPQTPARILRKFRVCACCGHTICDAEFTLSGSNPYHKTCYRELYPECVVCGKSLPTSVPGSYKVHVYRGQKYCHSHERDGTPCCCSCHVLGSKSIFVLLGDGRNLCLECLESAVMNTNDCQPLYHSIRNYFEGINMKISQQIPMLLVERQTLAEAKRRANIGHHDNEESVGITICEEQTFSIFKRLIYPWKLIPRWKVASILILYGLPRLLTGSLLAHELMHGWLRLNGYHHLRPEVKEGICQVLAYMWLGSEVLPGPSCVPSSSTYASSSLLEKAKKSDSEIKLGKFFMYQIANHSSKVYRDGFLAAHAAVYKYGLHPTLDHIYKTGNFPV